MSHHFDVTWFYWVLAAVCCAVLIMPVAVVQAKLVLQEAKAILRASRKELQPSGLPSCAPAEAILAYSAQVATAGIQPQATANLRRLADKPHNTHNGQLHAEQPDVDSQKPEACLICMEAQVQVIFSPCGHAVACQACFALLAGHSNECPVCRCNVQQRTKLELI